MEYNNSSIYKYLSKFSWALTTLRNASSAPGTWAAHMHSCCRCSRLTHLAFIWVQRKRKLPVPSTHRCSVAANAQLQARVPFFVVVQSVQAHLQCVIVTVRLKHPSHHRHVCYVKLRPF